MGKVYRAEDTALGREVAVKVLPEAVAQDPERLARFEREARVLATLSHPRIAAVHEFGAADGVHFLVMELAAGETLADRIARGALPLAEALPIALQIAEALEAAHERGIVHRDLKPANVKVAPDGAVKVLDFGLAKAFERDAASGSGIELTHSPTLTGRATMGGVLLGTAAYMSPEQAAGRPADRRSDIWAFGVVLLEMLGGRQVFTGETVSHVLAAVLKDEPDWGGLEPDLPSRVLDLLQHCVRKDPKRRLQAIGDARVALEEWLADPRVLAAPPAAAGAPAARRPPLAPWGLAAVLAAALAGVLLWQGRTRPAGQPPDLVRIPLELASEQALALDNYSAAALSPDGRRQALVIVEQDTRRLLLRELDRLDPRVLPDTDGASSPFFSPDGEWLGFFAGGALRKVSLAGGPAVTLAQASDNRGATWTEDGTIYFAPTTDGGLQRISDQGGPLTPATELDGERGERTHRWPEALPGGAVVLFTSDTFETTEFYDDARIEALVVATGERRVVLEQSSRTQYLEPGRLVFARGGTLFAVPFDPVDLEVEGAPVPVVQQVATDVATGAAHFSVSRVGSLLYVPGDLSVGLSRPQWADRQGKAAPAELDVGRYAQVRLSPDGRRAAFSLGTTQTIDLWVADFERGAMSRLTFEGFAQDPVWTPDGRRLAYDLSWSGQGGRLVNALYWRSADGSGEAEALWQGDGTAAYAECFSPDGEFLVFSRSSSANQSDLLLLPLAGERTPRPLVETPFDEYMAEFSPDGRWFAYASNESGRYEVFVRPFPPGPGGKWQVSNGVGSEPHWGSDGRELFYRSGGTLMRVPVETAQGFAAGRPEPLFDGLRTGGAPLTYAVTRDGRFLYLPGGTAARVGRAALVLDWRSEVERLTTRQR